MRSDSWELIASGGELTDQLSGGPFPAAQNDTEKLVRQSHRVAKVFHRVARAGGDDVRGGLTIGRPHFLSCNQVHGPDLLLRFSSHDRLPYRTSPCALTKFLSICMELTVDWPQKRGYTLFTIDRSPTTEQARKNSVDA